MDIKVLVLGLDGATNKLLRPWIREGELPYLRSLKEGGVHGDLKTLVPTLSPIEWAGFSTGRNPAKLGVFGVNQIEDPRKNPEPKLMSSEHIEGITLWSYLSNCGKRVGVMNIPATYPPREVNGFLVSGMMTPPSAEENGEYYYPPELGKYLGDYEISLGVEELGELPDKEIDKEELSEKIIVVHKKRVRAIHRLLSDFSLDLFIVNFKEIDDLQHLFWEDKEKLLSFYKMVDKNMWKITKEFDPSHVFVISDHGFHGAEEKYLYTNTWLENEGYLNKTTLGRIYSLIHPLLKKALRGKIRELIPSKLKSRKGVASISNKMIDFQETDAYANMWGVYINNDSKELKKELKKELRAAEDPKKGERIFKEVIDTREIYQGPYLSELPDLLVLPSPEFLPNTALANHLSDRRVDKPYLEGAHKSDPHGILYAAGENIKRGTKVEEASILDLAPTLIHILNEIIPPEMDGRILKEAFK